MKEKVMDKNKKKIMKKKDIEKIVKKFMVKIVDFFFGPSVLLLPWSPAPLMGLNGSNQCLWRSSSVRHCNGEGLQRDVWHRCYG